MATLDNINLFANGGPTENNIEDDYQRLVAVINSPGIMGTPPTFEEFVAMRQKSQAADVARETMLSQLGEGNVKQAYEEGFTQLPLMEQLGAYVFPPTGVPIESYETGYFTDQAGYGMKSPQEFALDVLNPNKNIFQKFPVKAEDPMSAVLAPLSALGAIGGAFELANIPKAGLMALKRYQQKTMDGGGGGIGGLPPTTFKEDIQKYATYDGFVSPTVEALITKAPKNLKGQGIVDWMKANADKGVKPKEMKFMGIEGYVAENPKATLREVIEGTSENKIEIGTQTKLEESGGSDFRFSNEDLYEDPLDGSKLYQNVIDDLEYDIRQGDVGEFTAVDDMAHAYYGRLTPDERKQFGAGVYNPRFTFEDMVDRINKGLDTGMSNETLDEVIEQYARDSYMENPYELIAPSGDGAPTGINQGDTPDTFAFGNDETGYSIFVNGERITITDGRDVPYSRGEAEMQLRDAMEEIGIIDEFVEGQAKHKDYIDGNMPGGRGYEEKVYTWDNADDYHNVSDHYDEDNQIASAIMRDRLLEDGTMSKHADEIQSDLHAAGYRFGYKDPVNDPIELEKIAKDTKEYNLEVDKLVEKTKSDVERFKQQYPTALDDSYAYRKLDGTFIGEIDVAFDEIASIATDSGGIPKRNSAALTKIEKILSILEAREISALEKKGIIVNRNEGMHRVGIGPGTDGEEIFLDFHSKTKDGAYGDYYALSDRNIDLLKRKRVLEDKVPEYPFKDDYHEMIIKKMIKQAIDEDLPAVSVATSASMIDRWGRGPDDSYYKLYTNLYDRKIPNFMEKFAKKYDGVFEKAGSLDMDDIYGSGTTEILTPLRDNPPGYTLTQRTNNAKANIIRITPQMRNKILEEGLPSMYMGGKVTKSNTMDRPIVGNRREM